MTNCDVHVSQVRKTQPLRALVVEDCEFSRSLIECYLELLEIQFTSVGSGEDAIDAAQDPFIDLVLTDLNLNGINGYELIERISAVRSDLKFIGMSASSASSIPERFKVCGAAGFLPKPYDLNVITRVIRNVVGVDRLPVRNRSV